MEGTAEQGAKNQAALEWLEGREAAYARLSGEEKESLARQWQAFKRAMNENYSGHRKPYPDERD